MQKFKLLTITVLLCFSTNAMAIEAEVFQTKISHATMLNGIALNAAAATRTFTITNPSGSYATANLTMNRTRGAGADLTMTCTRDSSTGGKVQRCEYAAASGTCTHYDVTWKSTTSSTEKLAWAVDVRGYVTTVCVVASTSADGTDLLTVTGALVTQ